MLTEVSNPSYAKNIDITNPYVSPAYADLTGISPMLIIAGGDELLLDDTALVSAHAKAAGVQVNRKILSWYVTWLGYIVARITRIKSDERTDLLNFNKWTFLKW